MWWDGQRHFPKKAVTMFCIAKCELQSDADGKSEGDGDPSSALRCKALWLCHCTAAGCYQLSLDSWLSFRVLLGPAPPQCTQAMQPLLVQGFWCGVQWGHSHIHKICVSDLQCEGHCLSCKVSLTAHFVFCGWATSPVWADTTRSEHSWSEQSWLYKKQI